MAQPTYSQVRQYLAAYINSVTGLRTSANRIQVNPPMGLVVPETGTFVTYSESFDGAAVYRMRLILFASLADSAAGQDIIDQYVTTTGTQSIWAAVKASPSLGGNPVDAAVIEATGYGVINAEGVDYQACHFIVEAYV